VPGGTLTDLLRQRGKLPQREAATLMRDVLDAIATAHAQGIVHRDLKPSNILLGRDGRARVMDFGIAARVGGPGAAQAGIVGTPGYISPEAARGEAPAPAMDVFSAGLLLGELLTGRPLLVERDVRRALARVQNEDLALPAAAPLDDGLRSLVQRAIARDRGQRPEGARAMHQALAAWLQPASAPVPDRAGHGTLDFLLRRMRHKGDFPALSESVANIQRVAASETESLGRLAGEILKDVALTNKLLRVVNTAHFSAAGGTVSTISRAVALLGFAGIRNLALSLLLLEHMRDKSHAAQLKEEFVRSLLAGTLADRLAANPRDGEEAFLGSMFQNLGRLLTEYYFPEEAQQIQQLLPAADAPAAARDAAAQRVLGIGYEELGIGIARSWGLPDGLLRCMRVPAGEAPPRAVEGGERQRWLGRVGNEIAEAMLHDEGEPLQRRLAALAARYAPALGLAAGTIVQAAQDARERLAQLAPAMGLQLAPSAKARRLVQSVGAPAADSLAPHRLQATIAEPMPPAAGMAEVLAAGIQDITNAMVDEHFKLNEVLRMVLETMYRALGFRRVVFCLRDPKTETLTGRFGIGEAADAACKAMRVPLRLGAEPDLFAAVCAKGADTLIADAGAANIAGRLPAWYRRTIAAPAFVLLPMTMKGAPFALIYADKAEAGAIALGDKELSLLRTLRNQAVMAFRQSER